MLFRLHAYRFTFLARAPIFFPPGKAGNVFRGALGLCFRGVVCDPACQDSSTCPVTDCAYSRLFAPRNTAGPSGFADAPRPFVLRAAHLDNVHVHTGESFSLGVHVFDLASPVVQYFALAFTRLMEEGLGPGRGSVELQRIEAAGRSIFHAGRFLTGDPPSPALIDLATPQPAARIRVTFLTPTEIKAAGGILQEPGFDALFARIRDRISNLRKLYDGGPLPLDFRPQNERASLVQLTARQLEHQHHDRFSTRTGQQHPLSGFTGSVEFEGDLGEFIPYLRAGEFTGVGRQTVWGKGAYHVEIIA